MPGSRSVDHIVHYPAKHCRVLGMPGTGKTRLLIDRFKALSHDAPDRPSFIITYSREQLQRITEAVLEAGTGHAGVPPVMTHFMLAREVLSASGNLVPRILEALEERLLVERIVKDHATKLKSHYRRISDSERFQRELLGVFHFLLQNDVVGERLDRVACQTARGALHDVIVLYRAFVAAVTAENAATFYDISWNAARSVESLPAGSPLRNAHVLLVDDFQDIDAGQFALLCALAPPNGETVLNVAGDPLGAYFASRGTSARWLVDVFPSVYEAETFTLDRRCLGDTSLHDVLDVLAGELPGGSAPRDRSSAPPSDWGPLFDASASPAPANHTDDALFEVRVVDDEVAEVYAAAEFAHELLTSGKHTPSDIAVITNEKARYEPMLGAAFLQRGVPLDTGRPVHGTFRGFVHALLKLLVAPHDSVAMQSLVTSPFFAYFRHSGEGVDERNFDAPSVQEAMRKYAKEHAGLMRSQPVSEWIPYIVSGCVSPACAAWVSETGDESIYSFLSTLRERWAVYATIAERTHSQISIASFLKKSGLFRLQSMTPAPSRHEVGFYSSREVKSASFPVVIVMGCSEMLFPSVLQRETILPAGDLQALLDSAFPDDGMRVYEARTPEEHLDEQHQLLYHSLTRATERLVVLSPRSFAGQAHPAPSEALKQAGRIVEAGVRSQAGAAASLPPSIRFARSWVTRPVGAASTTGKGQRPADAGAGLSADAAARLAELSPMGDLWNLSPLEQEQFAVERFPISKTSLENYVKCPRRFFYTKVLRVREEESGALTVGKIFHEALSTLAESAGTRREFHAGATDDRIREAVDEQIEKDRKVVPQSLFGEALRFYLYLMIKAALRIDADTSDDYDITGVEIPLDFEHGGFKFTGRVDIVQTSTAGSTLVDYKSGNFTRMAKTLRERTLDALERPERANWQVPIYVWGHRPTADTFPAAFKHLVQMPGGDPFIVTLHVRKSKAEIPAAAASNKRQDQEHSYLLHSEVEAIMERAATHAADIFSARAGFDKTDDVTVCRNCAFNSLCDRRAE
jgi:superfamily I DNA/RNA helicase